MKGVLLRRGLISDSSKEFFREAFFKLQPFFIEPTRGVRQRTLLYSKEFHVKPTFDLKTFKKSHTFESSNMYLKSLAPWKIRRGDNLRINQQEGLCRSQRTEQNSSYQQHDRRDTLMRVCHCRWAVFLRVRLQVCGKNTPDRGKGEGEGEGSGPSRD